MDLGIGVLFEVVNVFESRNLVGGLVGLVSFL